MLGRDVLRVGRHSVVHQDPVQASGGLVVAEEGLVTAVAGPQGQKSGAEQVGELSGESDGIGRRGVGSHQADLGVDGKISLTLGPLYLPTWLHEFPARFAACRGSKRLSRAVTSSD